ncbi:hypothetical protein T440DRAFT_551825 [Plenodomus tracheiphilus IPT5]|uniref:Uncharacterized protein n=1 Tax=Plenodomus tracheiphilus IPT5 TaxID=1408161 RepID=A0A6A7BJX8_9PLEO|nr:hypothetical protein T440DRAFT_551825 [Plenodomus tracheiphilus IPT5]
MNHLRTTHPLRRALPTPCRTTKLSNRTYATNPSSPHPQTSPQTPNPRPTSPPSRTSTYYTTFASPILKSFLGALFTYQLAYYAWLKLEALEEAHDKKAQISGLQAELREAVEGQRRKAGGEGGEGAVEDKVKEVGDKVVEGGRGTGVLGKVGKGGWWPW